MVAQMWGRCCRVSVTQFSMPHMLLPGHHWWLSACAINYSATQLARHCVHNCTLMNAAHASTKSAFTVEKQSP